MNNATFINFIRLVNFLFSIFSIKICEFHISSQNSLKFLYFTRYIQLLSNVLEWQKTQERNEGMQHEVRIKCEPNLNAQNSTGHHAKSTVYLKQEKQMNENHAYKTSFTSQKQLQHTISHIVCDKNGNNLLMIALSGHNVSNSVCKKSITPSMTVAQNSLTANALSNASLTRPPGSRPSIYPKSPQINVQVVSSSSILTCSSAPVTSNASTITGSVANCGQKRLLKIEKEEEEQMVQGQSRDCKGLPSTVHGVLTRKRVKVTFIKESSSGFRTNEFRNVERK